MPPSPSVLPDVTTINYTLGWPHLENPSNTTFAGAPQIDICRCGPNNVDLGHVYTRYRCPRPEISFATADEELWVLQVPLGQVNLLRPANSEELQRRREIHDAAEPTAYAGKNFLLLSGPCPRGRYQAYATLRYLESLSPAARQNIEHLSLLVQPYEEDCSDDQGGRAYLDLAHYIVERLPAFKTLCLNIWGEETRIGSREFAMVLWKEGITIVVSWDWWSGEKEEYTDVENFWRGIDGGVVKQRPAWEGGRGGEDASDSDGHDEQSLVESAESLDAHRLSRDTLVHGGHERTIAIWEEVSQEDNDYDSGQEDGASVRDEQALDQEGTEDEAEPDAKSVRDATTHMHEDASSDDEWSDALLTPLSPTGIDSNDHASWQVL